jgi:hypothetical protein
MARHPSIDDFHNPEDALAAASKMDMHGDWDDAIALYRRVAERWPEHLEYSNKCIEAIQEKRRLTARLEVGQEIPMGVGDWLTTLLVLAIPIVNIIMCFVWALSDSGNVNRKTYCQALLIWFSIIVALVFILSLLGVRIQDRFRK